MSTLLSKPLKLFFKIFSIFLIFSAILVGIIRSFFPYIDRYRPLLEDWASQSLHQIVKINHLQATWKGLYPLFDLKNLVVLDENKKTKRITIENLRLGVNVIQSVLHGHLVLGSVNISGTQLSIRPLEEGKWEINGIAIEGNSSQSQWDTQKVAEWISSQGQIGVKDVDLELLTRQGVLVLIKDIQIQIKNNFFHKQMTGLATWIQSKQPVPFHFVIDLSANNFNPKKIQANVYFSIKNVLLDPLLAEYHWNNLAILQGHLNQLELWATWKDQNWQKIQTIFALNKVVLQTHQPANTLTLDEGTGNVGWLRNKTGWQLFGDHLQLTLNKHPWPLSRFNFWEELEKDIPVKQILYVDTLYLTQLQNLLPNFYSIPAFIQKPLNQLKPKGKIKDIFVWRDMSTEGKSFLSTVLDIEELKTSSWKKIPGIEGLSGHLQITPTSGNIQLQGMHLALDFEKLFSQPLVFDQYTGHLKWLIHDKGWSFSSSNLNLSNANLNVHGDMDLFEAKDNPDPIIKLHASVSEKDASHLRDYVPVGLLNTKLSEWLKKAFTAGDGVEGNILLQGPLSHFPFSDHSGQFQVITHLNNITFNYSENWPQLSHVRGQAFLNGKSIKINISEANIFDIKMNPIHAEIPDFSHPELMIKGGAHTEIEQGLKFLERSPLEKDFAGLLENVELKGQMQLNVGLQIPFYSESEHFQLQGDVLIEPDAVLSLPKWGIDVDHLGGKFNFTQKNVFADNLNAQWLGQPLHITINTTSSSPENSNIALKIKGHMPLSVLTKKYNLDALSNSIKGETDYTFLLKLINSGNKSHTVFSMDSNLEGISITLPAPLAKLPSEKAPTHVEMELNDKSDFLDLELQYAEKLKAIATLEKSTDSWSIAIDSPIMVGDIFIPKNLSTQPIEGEFEQFYLKSGASKEVSQVKPENIPRLKLNIQKLYYDSRLLGSVLLITAPLKNALQIQKLTLNTPKLQVVATGEWKELPLGHHQTTINASLNSADIGSVLKGWDVTDSIKGGQGKATFNFSWPSAAYDFIINKLNGNFSLSFRNGRIINISKSSSAEMGIGRILNLLSLQTLPRRLSLDFSDLTQKGFSFDKMNGDFSVKEGDAFTENAYINGPIAKVQVKGRIGLGTKDYNLMMMITPYVTSSLPIAATIAGGPVAGAATWMVNRVFRSVVNHIVMHKYQVVGPWDSPVVSKLGEQKQ